LHTTDNPLATLKVKAPEIIPTFPMKLSLLLLAASLGSVTLASAQTTPTAPGAPGTTTASPSAVPSGTAPAPSNPNGAVSAGEVFTTGAPADNSTDKRSTKRKKDKTTMDGKGKMKTKM
jgi:hypothetical protein